MATNDVRFSIILPTYNREFILSKAVDSVLGQTCQEFELLIIDDGSTDNTKDMIYERYSSELDSNKIRYISNKSNAGVSRSRNIGLKESKNEWICYIDSDNCWKDNYLDVFRKSILDNSDTEMFYCQFQYVNGNVGVSSAFDYSRLTEGNYIDLGVFVHSRSMYEKYGGFDPHLKRLNDWDLIVRYTRENHPVFIDEKLMIYDNGDRPDRISCKEDFHKALETVQKKNRIRRLYYS